jgi:DNA-binding transcriptional MocR family regulator
VLVDRSADSIAKAFGALVRVDVLVSGDKLPPIRAVAAHLGVSTTTVSDAWATMTAHGMIETDRRRGTRVRAVPASGRSRYWQVPAAPGTLPIDLSTGTPDPGLLPDIGPILARISTDLGVTSYVDQPLLDSLDGALRALWPYEPPALTVVDGALDGFERTLRSLIGLGDTVVVEDPTYPPLLDALEAAGATVIGLALDDEGIRVDAFADAMERAPRAIVIQTGAHNPTGIEITSGRLAQIAAIVEGTNTLVIEDAQGWDSDRNFRSVGITHPEQTVRIQSFSKTHGPDLRIAALAGPGELIDNIVDRRQLGSGWTSRLMQRVLAEMLDDDEVETRVNSAFTTYAFRRQRLMTALEEHGVVAPSSKGLNVWLPVRDEQRATVALAALGIGVAPGRPFLVDRSDGFIRVTVAMLDDNVDIEMVASALAMAATA